MLRSMRNFQQYPLPALNFQLSAHNKPAAPELVKVWLRCKDDLGPVSGNVIPLCVCQAQSTRKSLSIGHAHSSTALWRLENGSMMNCRETTCSMRANSEPRENRPYEPCSKASLGVNSACRMALSLTEPTSTHGNAMSSSMIRRVVPFWMTPPGFGASSPSQPLP